MPPEGVLDLALGLSASFESGSSAMAFRARCLSESRSLLCKTRDDVGVRFQASSIQGLGHVRPFIVVVRELVRHTTAQ